MNCLLCKSEINQVNLFQRNEFLICNNCYLVFLNPKKRICKTEEKQRYDTHENEIDDPRYINYLNRIMAPLKRYIKTDHKCLDYGCGPSKGMESVFNELAYTMESYDPLFYPDLEFSKYNIITCNEAVEHFYDPEKEFSKLVSLMKPNAYLLIGTNLWNEETDFDKWFYISDPTHVCLYNKKTLSYIANKYNLKLIYQEKTVSILQAL